MKISARMEPKISPSSKVGGQLKSSHFNAVHLKNHLAWYVALNSKAKEEKICCSPQIKWKCPPTFTLNPIWNISAGEGSQEAASQKCRETTLLEAVYPRPSCIPPNPSSLMNIEDENCHNSLIPVIPIIPIEEAAAGSEQPLDASAPVGTMDSQPLAAEKCVSVSENPLISQSSSSGHLDQHDNDKCPREVLCGLESGDLEVAAAAAATVAAVMESKEQIDTELLIKLLSDPEMVKKLIDEHGLRHGGNPPAPKLCASSSFSSPKPGSVDKMVNYYSEPVAAFVPSNSKPETVNPSLALPSSKPGSVGKMVNDYSRHSNSKPKTVSPSLGLPCSKAEKAAVKPARGPYSRCNGSDRPVCTSTSRSNTDAHSLGQTAGVGLASIKVCRPEVELNTLVKQYRPVDIGSVSSPNPPISTTNKEAIRKMISQYGVPEKNMKNAVAHGQRWESNSSMVPKITSTGISHFAPLIKEHGQKHDKYNTEGLEFAHLNATLIEKYHKPCIFFSTAKGCWKGSSCPYLHHYVSKQWRDGELTVTVPKRMKFSDPFQNFN